MKKWTHLLLTKELVSTLFISKCKGFWLCFGSVFPDLTPMCLLKPHRYDSRNIKILRKYYSLDFSDKDWLFYFKLGIIGHYFADFFTSPHNRKGVVGFCTNHRNYESELHRFFKCNLSSYKFPSTKYYNLDIFLNSYHTKYMNEDSCYENDFKYICTAVYYLFKYSKSRCEVKNDNSDSNSKSKALGVCS